MDADPRRPRGARRRCCGCSRATSARARPRSPPTPWRPPRGPGCQGALLAPTDLLARQHRETRRRAARRTSGSTSCSSPARSRPRADAARHRGHRVRAGVGRRRDARAVPGGGRVRATSAWPSSTSSTGSASSSAASSRRRRAATSPHVLLMTATPDPAHARPGPVRRPRRVRPADAAGRAGCRSGPGSGARTTSTPTWAQVREEAAAGPSDVRRRAAHRGGQRRRRRRQHDSSAVAAETEAERLHELLAPLRVGLVHGRMKPVDRDAEMARFRDGDLDVLVGTTVVEVGRRRARRRR